MRKNAYLIIGAIACFYLVNNFIWLNFNTYPSGPDEAAHLSISQQFLRTILKNPVNLFSSEASGHWPPLFHISSAVLNLFLGNFYLSSVMINIPYLIILLFSVYFIALRLFDKNTGIFAAIFISIYPMMFIYSRVFNPDFALTAMVCAGICLLIYSGYFVDTKFSILFGISVGLGMLTKWTFILFVIGPLMYVLTHICFIKKAEARLKKRLINIICSAAIGILISCIWYLPAFSTVIKRIAMFLWTTIYYHPQIDPGLNTQPFLHFNKFFDYLTSLINEQISLLFFVVFLTTGLLFILRRKNKLLFLLWYAVPCIILSLSYQNQGRFLMPSLPALAIISAAGLQSIRSKTYRRLICYALILLGIIQFFDISYNANRKGRTFPVQTSFGPIHALYSPVSSAHDWAYGPPARKDWRVKEIAAVIAEYYKYIADNSSLTIGVICEDDYVREIFGDRHIIDYYFMREKYIADFETVNLLVYRDVLDFIARSTEIDSVIVISRNNRWSRYDNVKERFGQLLLRWRENLSSEKYIIPDEMPVNIIDDAFIEKSHEGLREFLNMRDSGFELLEQIKLPANYSTYIYVKDNYLVKKDSFILSFFNGCTALWYNEKGLIPGGISTSFRYKDKAYHSSTASWEVRKLGDNRLEAEGRWQGLPGITQIWQLELVDDEEVICEVNLENEKLLEIKDFRIQALIPEQYRFYRALGRRKPFYFRARMHKNVVEEALAYIGIEQYRSLPALLFYTQDADIPSFLTVESIREDSSSWHSIGLTANVSDGRITMPAGIHLLSNLRISIFPDNPTGLIDRIKEINDRLTIKKGMLQLFFFNGIAGLWHNDNDKELIARRISTIFRHKDKAYHSSTASWEVRKLGDNRLEAEGRWQGLPGITQIWQFELVDDEKAICDVGLRIDRGVDVRALGRAKIEFLLNGDYRRWLTVYNKGKFRNMGEGGIILKDATAKLIGAFDSLRAGSLYPGVFLILKDPDYSLAQVHYSSDSRRFIYWTDCRIDRLHFDGQNYSLFKAHIEVVKSGKELKELIEGQRLKELERRDKLRSKYSLHKDNVSVFLDFGQGRVYWKGREVTAGFGFYTSILANGYWQDSQNVLWEIEKLDDSIILAQGRWVGLPLTQTWEIKLINEGLIQWNIELEIYEKIKLDEVQANIILNEDYKVSNTGILAATSQQHSMPENIRFMLASNNSMCHKPKITRADFLNSKSIILQHYNTLSDSIEPSGYKNYFAGEIRME